MRILGLGVDIVETARIAGSIERLGQRFLDRVFLASEQEYCARINPPERCYAARFAAKEAVAKAFGTGIGEALSLLDIEVCRKGSGEPFIVLRGDGAATAARMGISEIRISLSHSDHYAVASALAIG